MRIKGRKERAFKGPLGIEGLYETILGRPLGHFIFSPVGLKEDLICEYFSEALRGQPSI